MRHRHWPASELGLPLTNILLLALAFAIVARRISVAWAIMILAGPLIWWIDKAHGDVFTVALLAMACALWHTRRAWTVTIVAVAAAQNPALVPVWAFTCVMALWPVIKATLTRTRRALPRREGSWPPQPRLVIAVALSAAIVAMPLAYYQLRLGIWSPLIGYTQPSWPSMRVAISLLVDPNIGLLPNAPFVAIAAVWAIAAARSSRAIRGDSDPGSSARWILAAGAWILMLAAYAQSVNFNHGATPGINRWTLWLTPWLLLIVGPPAPAEEAQPNGTHPTAGTVGRAGTAGQTSTHRRARRAQVLTGLATLQLLWSVWFFRPSVPEVYRYPTMTASWLWTHAPRWYSPAPEIFAERVSHREPPVLPIALPGCTKVLIIDGQWPVPCVPTAPAPPSCLGADRLCYAAPSASAAPSSIAGKTPTTFTPLGSASFPWIPAAHTWPGNAPFIAALRGELTMTNGHDPIGLDPADAVVRATNRVRWANAWSGPSVLAIYAENVSPPASLDVRVDADYHGQLIDLDARRVLGSLTIARSADRPSVISLPFTVEHALLLFERAR